MRKIYILLIAAVFTTISCKKENQSNTGGVGNTDGSTGGTKKYLPSKITMVNDGTGAVDNITFQYDTNNRLTKAAYSIGGFSISYSYNNEGNLIRYEEATPTIKNVTELTYENGKLTSGIVSEIVGGTVSESYHATYTLNSNNQVSKISYDGGQGDVIITYDAMGNITKVQSSEYSLDYTYSTQKGVFTDVLLKDYFKLGLSMPNLAKFDVKDENRINAVGSTENKAYTTTYNTAGYPISSKLKTTTTGTGGSSTTNTTLTFEYTIR